jgi:predicted CopG family antitoxin
MPERKMVSLTENTYKKLAQMGTLEDSFDSVILRLIENQKAVSGSSSFQGLERQTTAAETELVKHGGKTS